MRALISSLFMLTVLAGCATPETRASGSWVEPLAAKDGPRLVTAICDLVQQRIKSSKATLVVSPPQPGQTDNPVALLLAETLRRKGYAVIDQDQVSAGADAHLLRYVITPRGDGVLLRVVLDKIEAARILPRGKSGELEAAAPFAIREAS
jgi:hypothetical protein